MRSTADLYNLAIEKLIYQPLVRRAFGLRAAAEAYFFVGYLANSWYTRIGPDGPFTHGADLAIERAFRL